MAPRVGMAALAGVRRPAPAASRREDAAEARDAADGRQPVRTRAAAEARQTTEGWTQAAACTKAALDPPAARRRSRAVAPEAPLAAACRALVAARRQP